MHHVSKIDYGTAQIPEAREKQSACCVHSFENVGTEPARWIETHSPSPPDEEVFQFEKDGVQLG